MSEELDRATAILLAVANGDAALALIALEQDREANGSVSIERCVAIIQAALSTIH